MLNTAFRSPPAPMAALMPTVTIRLRELMREKTIRDGRNPDYQAITQEEVADAIGVTRVTMSAWARGKVERLDRDILAKLCQYFDCGIEDLLHLEKDS
jgi:DNA-binding Xre family transcriptional regulator